MLEPSELSLLPGNQQSYVSSGYTDSCRTIVSASRSFAKALKTRFNEDLYVLGDPKVSVVAFSSKTLNIYAIGDAMSKKGWHLSALANPPALHMAFTVGCREIYNRESLAHGSCLRPEV